MITEDYVSFEIAKLLKEKGFNGDIEHKIWYVIKQFSTGCHWNSCTYKVGDTTREYDEDCCIPMPTLQMAMKWLREVHNIHIEIARGPKGYHITIVTIPFGVVKYITRDIVGTTYVDSYEEACETSIKYCLENLI